MSKTIILRRSVTVDLYFQDPVFKFRIFANGSILASDGKKLVVAENFSILMGLFGPKGNER